MYRSDYHGPQIPERLRKLVAKAGGRNILNEPNYRLVYSNFRTAPSGGVWVDWKDNLTTSERNDFDNTPVRRVVEVRHIPLYPATPDMWILEKWCSPEAYGTRFAWNLPTSQGGTVLYIPSERRSIHTLGEYPHRGDYENYGFAFPSGALTEAVVLTAIGRIEHAIDQMPSTPEGRMLRKVYNAVAAHEDKQKKAKQFTLDVLNDAGFAFHGQPFSAAGVPKQAHSSQEILKKLGIKSHHI